MILGIKVGLCFKNLFQICTECELFPFLPQEGEKMGFKGFVIKVRVFGFAPTHTNFFLDFQGAFTCQMDMDLG